MASHIVQDRNDLSQGAPETGSGQEAMLQNQLNQTVFGATEDTDMALPGPGIRSASPRGRLIAGRTSRLEILLLRERGGTELVAWRRDVNMLLENGLTRKQLASIGSYRMTKDRLTAEDICAICLGKFSVGKFNSVLPCNHQFHTACVRRWLKQKSTCPCCRQSAIKA